ncbi:hypothetical protein X975_10187, partial [Stegodyphus mimosarum]
KTTYYDSPFCFHLLIRSYIPVIWFLKFQGKLVNFCLFDFFIF